MNLVAELEIVLVKNYALEEGTKMHDCIQGLASEVPVNKERIREIMKLPEAKKVNLKYKEFRLGRDEYLEVFG